MALGSEKTAGNETRLFFLDNLRLSLVVLVVIHHIALVYGAAAPFYYVEPPMPTQFKAFQGFLLFVAVNQAYFMGILFFLSGCFTPLSFDRKGLKSFIKAKVLRLGIPLAACIFALNPLAAMGFYLMPPELTGIAGGPHWADYPELIGLGPAWFIALLLIFNAGYAAWRRFKPDGGKSAGGNGGRKSVPGPVPILLFTAVLAAASYLMRLVVPIGKSVADFPTLAYLPQYLGFYVLGLAACRKDWVRALPISTGILGFALAAAATVFLLPAAVGGRMFHLSLTPDLDRALGGGHWRSAAYAAWDSMFSVGMLLGLPVLFRSAFNRGSGFGRHLASRSYAVYIIHSPIIVFVCYAIRDIGLEPFPKFLAACLVIIPACFLAAWLIRKIPGSKKIL